MEGFMGYLSTAMGVISIIGYWKLLEKCGIPGWWSLIPFANVYQLGVAAGKSKQGIIYIVCSVVGTITISAGIVAIMAGLFGNSADIDMVGFILCGIGSIALLAAFVMNIIIYAGLCETFGESGVWVIGWILISGIAAIIWGFDDNYQPIYVMADADEAQEAQAQEQMREYF